MECFSKGQLFYISGECGSGKSSAVTKLVLDWAQGQEAELLHNRFDFVFLIQLKYVDEDRPLEEEIIQQLGLQDTDVTVKEISFILDHTETLLTFDGYDEYEKGTSSAIDTKITGTKGNPFVLITSRPDHMPKKYKHKMDEVQLKGFSKAAVEECTERYLDSKKSKYFAQKAKDNRIYDLLKIPLLLLMLCVLFNENRSLPSNQTKLIEKLIELYILRTEKKGDHFEDKDKTLKNLAELSYQASTRKEKRRFVNKVFPHS